jgi:hypothetical protein
MRELAPFGLLEIGDDAEFTRRYVERLDRFGVAHFQRRFAEISAAHDGRGLVLFCFELAGEPCHRFTFARWFEGRTGEHVPELDDGQLVL